GLVGDVGVVVEDEGVGVQRDVQQLALDLHLVPDELGEILLVHAELAEQVEVPGVQQTAGRVAGHAGRVHHGDVRGAPAGRGHRELRVVRGAPAEHGLGDVAGALGGHVVGQQLAHGHAVGSGEQVPEGDLLGGGGAAAA